MKEHALIYLGETIEHKNELISLLKDNDFDYTFLNDSDLTQDVISLFDLQKESKTSNFLFPFNFIFFKDIDHEKILSFYKQCQIAGFPFSHKAVMTVHNQNWIMQDLLSEIAKEHEFFQAWELLNNLLREANQCDANLYTSTSYEPYQRAFINAYIYKKQAQPVKEEMEMHIQQMLDTKAKLIKI